MASTTACYRHGISRVEACVALLILALLTALVLPAIQQARESTRRSQCVNTLRILALALHNYHDAMGTFPHACVGNSELPPEKRWSWYLCIGNYWGHYGTPIIDYERPWDDPALRPLQLHTWRNGPFEEFDVPLHPFPVIKCPNGTPKTHTDGQPFTDYVGTAGIAPTAALLPRNSVRAGVWSYEECRSHTDIRDGDSTTLLAIETSRNNGCWIAGGPATVRDYAIDRHPVGQGRQFGGLHNGGSMAVFVDGHVRFLAESISPIVLSSVFTIAGSEEVSSGALDPP